MAQGEGVAGANVFDIACLESGRFCCCDALFDGQQLTIRKDVCVDERFLGAGESARARSGCDAMIEQDPLWRQQLVEFGEVGRQLFAANVFEHSHGRNCVEFANYVAVVLHSNRHPIGETV